MSKIGKKTIKVPADVKLEIVDNQIALKSVRGEIKIPLLRGIQPILKENEISFELKDNLKQSYGNWGTLRALTANAIQGLAFGFERILILEGVGYKINKEGEDLLLSLGFSHPVRYKKPEGVTFEVEKNSILKIKGFNKILVNQTAADIRSLKKPEPYKGKGFRYSDEVIRRKAGKKVASQGG